jgi:FkbM family methyltransferase
MNSGNWNKIKRELRNNWSEPKSMAVVSKFQKIMTVFQTVSNWYMLPFDKLGMISRVKYRFRNGMHLYCRSRSTDINEACVVFAGLEYPVHLCRLTPAKNRSPVIVDLGGNIGAFPVLLKSVNPQLSLRFFVFEPHPDNATILRKNLELNHISDAEVVEKAVAGEGGRVLLDVSGGNDAFRIDPNSRASIEVEAVSLGDFIAERGIAQIDLLKIDVEGVEYDVIERDIENFAHCTKLMILEFHAPIHSAQHNALCTALARHFDVVVERDYTFGGVLSCRSR